MKQLLKFVVCFLALVNTGAAADRPNVLWIYLEDVSGWFSCYGDKVIKTPHIDALAESGIRFDRFYTSAGVCSAMRSATIVGAMQTSFGIHNHRSARSSWRGKAMGHVFDDIRLPHGVKTLPELMREHGYYTFNEGGKDDYNFYWEKDALYDFAPKKRGWGPAALVAGECWAGKKDGQPFFGQVQLGGGKLGGRAKKRIDRNVVPVPPYYPDIPLVRDEIAHHYDCLLTTDEQVGQIVAALKRDEFFDDTLIFLFSDHGYKLHRHKQFLYEGGIQMPLIVSGPGVAAGQVRTDLVSSIDIAPATLAAAGESIPKTMEGRNFLAANHRPREFVVAARDRCDYTIERIRAIVTPRFKYLRNYLTDRPYMQPNYKDDWPVSKKLRAMTAAGELNEVQMQFFGPEKPAEELYDLENDPHEIHNLAGDPKFAKELQHHHDLLNQWIQRTGDRGQQTESDVGLLAALRRWGNKCVNPEYDRVRPFLEQPQGKQGRHAAPNKSIASNKIGAAQGIMVGEVTASSALVQVRLTKTLGPVNGDVPGAAGVVGFSLVSAGQEVLRRTDEDATVVSSATQYFGQTIEANPDGDFIARVAFRDLLPNTEYVCRTAIGHDEKTAREGPVARFKTLPGAEKAERVSFVVVTGMNYAKFHGDSRIDRKQHLVENNTELPAPYAGSDKRLGYPALATILSLQPDFFVGTGDNVYYDTPDNPRAEKLSELRQKWHEQFVQPRFVDLFARVPTYWQVDDHDYRYDDGDNTGDYEPSPELGMRTLLEQLPYAPSDAKKPKTYRTHRVSRDLQIWLTENRAHRSPNAAPDGPGKTIWGDEQKRWLRESLASSDATFKLLVSPTPMIGPDDLRKTDNHTNINGFRYERDNFFAWLDESGVADQHFYLVCGDRHWQYHAVDPRGFEEFSCGALVDANSRLGREPGDPKSTDPNGTIKQHYSQDPASGGFLLIECEPAQDETPARLSFVFHDERGNILYRHEKHALPVLRR